MVQAAEPHCLKFLCLLTCRCMDHVMEHHPHWGIHYFAYDWFSAIRASLVRQVCMSHPIKIFILHFSIGFRD